MAGVGLIRPAVPQPAVALTNGQLFGSDGAGHTVAVNPTGNGQIDYAENITGTATTVGSSTTVDVPSTTIICPPSTRPTYISASLVFQFTATAPAGHAVAIVITEVSNGVDTVVPNWQGQALCPAAVNFDTVTVAVPARRVFASNTNTRTFKVQCNTVSIAGKVVNSAQQPTYISAESR